MIAVDLMMNSDDKEQMPPSSKQMPVTSTIQVPIM